LDQALKERLVGAAVILAAGVIVIPLLLDGPVRESEQFARDDVVTLPVPGKPETPAKNQDSEPEAQRVVENVPEPVKEVPAAARKPKKEAPKELPVERPKQKSVKADSRPVATPEPTWAVQVGSFASADNARGLAADLESGGFNAFVERWQGESGRVLFRVRVGPEATRADAEKLAARLGSRVQQTRVVEHEVSDKS